MDCSACNNHQRCIFCCLVHQRNGKTRKGR
uniref:Prion-related protein testis-specific n=1 Tax=Siphoviridae sp. ctYKh4 TaxID=2823586 RepID=A0A8S5LCS7_9CAUD|nr:MAG TPA: Prion-related protein testis-specific [Siphoviridae sp. ctYKh4]